MLTPGRTGQGIAAGYQTSGNWQEPPLRRADAWGSIKGLGRNATDDLGDTPHMSETAQQPADAMVIFGITGDLARKMTFRSLCRLEAGGQLNCPIIGVARDEWSDDHLRSAARQALDAAGEPAAGKVFDRLARRLSYLQGDFADPGTYQRLAERLKDSRRPLFYLEIPPSLFAAVGEALGRGGLAAGGD